jgi:hypothetical protein
MKSRKLIIFLIFSAFCIDNALAQAHTLITGCKFRKPLPKGWVVAADVSPCPVCRDNEIKERKAEKAEDNRRHEIRMAKVKADEVARLERKRLAEEEAKRIKDKEAADAIVRDAMMKKYKEIANKGQIKSDVHGGNVTSDLNVENIKPFNDAKRRIYGFQIDGTEVLTFPFENKYTDIRRIERTNYFQVTVAKPRESNPYFSEFSHCYIVNYLGEKMKFEGISTFDYPISVWTNTLYLYKKLSTPEECDNSECYEWESGSGITKEIEIFDTKESASAKLQTMIQRFSGSGVTVTICEKYSYHHVEQYKADLNCKLLEKTEGYQLRKQ